MKNVDLKNEQQCAIHDVRQSALNWWCTLTNKTKKDITNKNLDILIKGIPRTWQRLTDREIEKLYKVQHFA